MQKDQINFPMRLMNRRKKLDAVLMVLFHFKSGEDAEIVDGQPAPSFSGRRTLSLSG